MNELYKKRNGDICEVFIKVGVADDSVYETISSLDASKIMEYSKAEFNAKFERIECAPNA